MNGKLNFVMVLMSLICGCHYKSLEKNQINLQPQFQTGSKEVLSSIGNKEKIDPQGKIIHTRFRVDAPFSRVKLEENSYESYLRKLPLKPHGAEVQLYDESIKPDFNIYDAVVDLKIGKKDLHQCADAVMRLRAEYLWSHQKFDQIHFNFTNGFRVDYQKWRDGNRIEVNGNKTRWVKRVEPANDYKTFWKYLETIFTYAGTASLSKELKSVPIGDMNIGDVFIQGGFPGHAVIVVDMAEDDRNGQRIFLLAQSYMPAQEIQILKNPNNPTLSPWYSTKFEGVLNTPEWSFSQTDLKRFVQ